MDEKLYLIDLDCYARAEEKEKKKVKEPHCFDFGLLPTKGLQNEFRSFIENRSRQCALATMIQERVIYQRFCRMVKDKHIRAESLQELEWEQWLLKIRSWLLEHGQKLTMQGISVYEERGEAPCPFRSRDRYRVCGLEGCREGYGFCQGAVCGTGNV